MVDENENVIKQEQSLLRLLVLYDGDCAFCTRQWTIGKFRTDTELVKVVNFHKVPELLQKHGISHEQAMTQLYAVLPDGKVIAGMDVLREYDRIFGKIWGWRLTTYPPMRQLGDIFYFLFARYRYRLSRIFFRNWPPPACELNQPHKDN